MLVLIIILVVFGLYLLYSFVNKKRFVNLFSQGNVIVSGLKGKGKDMAFCIVVNSRKKDYISNVVYSSPNKRYKCLPIDFDPWRLSNNDYTRFISGDLFKYDYPYSDGIDTYISDAGVYFPAQYQSELVKKFPTYASFMALIRHLGDSNVHCNVQVQNRLWDKIREQSELFVVMHKCTRLPFTKLFHLVAYRYDLAESAEKQLKPLRGHGRKFKEAKFNFEIAHGRIERYSFWSKLPYKYDSRRFKELLHNGR